MHERIIDGIGKVLPKRRPFWKAILTSILLVLIIVLLLYPGTFWYLPFFGGVISIIGIILKWKILITSGMVFTGTIFFLSNLNMVLSPINIILLIGLFVLLYGTITYLNHLVKIDMIKRDSQGDLEDTLDRYMKNWNRSIIKNLSFVYLLALVAFMISWIGSFEFWVQMDNIVLLGVSSIFILGILLLLYVLFIKVPTSYKSDE